MDRGMVREFYDDLAPDYHLIYPDWERSVQAQGQALRRVIGEVVGEGRGRLLDCACGIGTQAIGLAPYYDVIGSDLSPVAAARAAREATSRGLRVQTVAADMCKLPFQAETFDVVVCADNSLAHLMTLDRLRTAFTSMSRVIRPGGLLVATTRSDAARELHPTSTPVNVVDTPAGQVLTFQLWRWHRDGEHYDMDHIQLVPHGDGYHVRARRTATWALSRIDVTEQAVAVGFTNLIWREPEETEFFQPILACTKRR